MLHVFAGDCAADVARAAGLPGEILAWRDSLAIGPAPLDRPAAERRALRAEFHGVEEADLDPEPADLAARSGPIALWFDACPWDQRILVELLDALAARAGERADDVLLILVGDHPEVERFSGFGQLTPAQLAALRPQLRPVEPRQIEIARAVHQAHGAADLSELDRLAFEEDLGALPFLAAAARRWLEELPEAGSGLSRTEREILEALAGGPLTLPALAAAVGEREAPNHGLWFGDLRLVAAVETLASEPGPALEIESGEVHRLRRTPLGGRLLAREADRSSHPALDRWVGGVRLTAASSPARRDPATGRLIRS